MTIQFDLENQPTIPLAAVQTAAEDASLPADLRQQLGDVHAIARTAMGTRWFDSFELVREDAFGQVFGHDFELWHEDEQIYSEGKQFLDAQQDYLDWLRPRCTTLRIGSSTYYLNHQIHTVEDWFYRANPAGFEHPNLS